MASTDRRRAVVIGGGIAGPATALALQKAGLTAEVYEARGPAESDIGAWLTVAPNGVAALRAIDVADAFAARAIPTDGITFRNSHGTIIGTIDQLRTGENMVLAAKRSTLHDVLRTELAARGIAISYHKRLERYEETHEGVRAWFEDGDSVAADLLIACDGFRSRTRGLLFPDLPAPVFTGVLGCGGFAMPQSAPPVTGRTEMIFGHKGFWGSLATPNGETWWFDSFPWPTEPKPGELAARSDAEWLSLLREVHAGDPAPVGNVLSSAAGPITAWPMYDSPALTTWSRGRVCLAGDAAHAMPPYAGQGASMALEDAVTLARCLRDLPAPEAAFAAFERVRRPRIAAVLKEVARNGGDRAPSSPIALKLRDAFMPLFLRMGQRRMADIVGEHIDWDQRVA